MTYALIMAGGIGSRMENACVPKQFLPLGNKPVIIHTAEKFCKMKEFEKILILCSQDRKDYTKKLLSEYLPEEKRTVVLCGGDDRNGTLMKGIEYIEENPGLDENTVVVTHDAVRPFVTERMIRESIGFAKDYGACCAVIPETDTVIESKDGKTSSAVPDRSELFRAQTPQSFKAELFKDCISRLTAEEKSTLTDACKIFTLCGHKVHLFSGDTRNIKITYPLDLKIAEVILNEAEG